MCCFNCSIFHYKILQSINKKINVICLSKEWYGAENRKNVNRVKENVSIVRYIYWLMGVSCVGNLFSLGRI
jgi:hypothetical protein